MPEITNTREKEQRADSQTGEESGCAYVVGVDVPRHVPVRDQLAVDVASDLAVPPAAVDVNDADHVPLSERGDAGSETVRNMRHAMIVAFALESLPCHMTRGLTINHNSKLH